MSDIKIEKDIPIPPTVANLKYPFVEMEVGDSFAIPAAEAPIVRSHIIYAQKKLSRKFKTKKISEDQVRVWRIE